MPRKYFNRARHSTGRRKSRRGGFKRRKGSSQALSHFGQVWKRPLTYAKQPTGFPDRMCVKLKYFDKYSISITTGIPQAQVWRGNDCFDPDLTGSGHQPNGFDQWSAFYNFQTVVASAVRVRVFPTTVTTVLTNTIEVVVFPNTASGVLNSKNVGTGREQVYAKWLTINAGNFPNTIRSYMSTAKMAGTAPTAISDAVSAYTNTVGASPTLAWYWHMYVNCVDEASSTSLIADVEIDYYVIFSGRDSLLPS